MPKLNLNNGSVLGNGTVTIAVTGTAVPLASTPSASTSCYAVIVAAHPSNAAQVWVGGSTVSASLGVETGMVLQANEKFTIEVDDISKVYVNGTSGDKLTYLFLN